MVDWTRYDEATTLDALCDALNAADEAGVDLEHEGVDLSSLPVFGGDEPAGAAAGDIWSWDEGRVLRHRGGVPRWYIEAR